MIHHPEARSNITLDEFIYCHGLRAEIKGLILEKKIYLDGEDIESVKEIDIELNYKTSELLSFIKALKKSTKYHQERGMK